jgi:hypothetical protein
VVFLFVTELATEMGFTDDYYTDGLVPSVSPSVLFSPTDFIAVTDGMSPSVKRDNVVVISFAGGTVRQVYIIAKQCSSLFAFPYSELQLYNFIWTLYFEFHS